MMKRVMEQAIKNRLQDGLKPIYLEVLNESSGHSVPRGSESHFKVVIVSDVFNGMAPLERHRIVNQTLQQEIPQIHALSIVARTPEQWEKKSAYEPSPKCKGGSKADQKPSL